MHRQKHGPGDVRHLWQPASYVSAPGSSPPASVHHWNRDGAATTTAGSRCRLGGMAIDFEHSMTIGGRPLRVRRAGRYGVTLGVVLVGGACGLMSGSKVCTNT